MNRHRSMPGLAAQVVFLLLVACAAAPARRQAEAPRKLYAHAVVLDRGGVIAPWYGGANGQFDWRARIALDTLKRFPWTDRKSAAALVPAYMLTGTWSITPDGQISVPPQSEWANGDLGQRAAYVLSGLVDAYRYTGDEAAITHLTLAADTLLDHALTPANHPWPRFLVSVPNKGKSFGKADPHGMIQVDITAEVGLALLRAYEMTGNRRWLEACRGWARQFALHCRPGADHSPWNRYANPDDVQWEDQQTGGVVFIVAFLDEMIRVDGASTPAGVVRARDAGRAYLRDVLLPRWTVNDTWGRNYWDWPDPVQAENVTEFVARYLIEHPGLFPNWRNDARNILGIFLNHTSVAPESGGDVYSGAWAYPESSGCCGRSLWYGPQELAPVWLQLGVAAHDPWAFEVGRRQAILATYDGHATGVVEDNIDGGPIVAGDWFKIAHPMSLKHVLAAMAWAPEQFGAAGEDHLMRTASVVRTVSYDQALVRYTVYDAPVGGTDVLRLGFAPREVAGDGKLLPRRSDLARNGWTCVRLPNGDNLVTIRHDGRLKIMVLGAGGAGGESTGRFTGAWDGTEDGRAASSQVGAAVEYRFVGDRFRLAGDVGPDGGLARVLVDGRARLGDLDGWSPRILAAPPVLDLNGLGPGPHVVRLEVLGRGNPRSRGSWVRVGRAQWSPAGLATSVPSAELRAPQRVVFGYPGRRELVDSRGNRWRPALEWTVRTGSLTDSVEQAWWTTPRRMAIQGTPDPGLYRYGAHAKEFTHWFTVSPGGTWHVRVKLAETRPVEAAPRLMTLRIQGRVVADRLDVAATAGGPNRAADLVFTGIRPVNGCISVSFTGEDGGEAICQAIEVGPGPAGPGARPVCRALVGTRSDGNLLANPGFEECVGGGLGSAGTRKAFPGWVGLFAGASQCYIWSETDYSIHPDWGLPEIRSGRQAMRTHTEGDGHTLILQEVPAVAGCRYDGTAWVRAVDLHGRGFGRHPGDRVLLRLQALDAAGGILGQAASDPVTDAGPYRAVTARLAAPAGTVRLRFVLDTVISGPYNEGHVTFDDARLAGVAGP